MPAKWRRPGLIAGVVLCLCLAVCAIFAPAIAPHSPDKQHLAHRLEGPSAEFPLGADKLGRCVASRLLYGLRPSLGLAVSVTLLVAVVGVVLGVTAAYFRPLDALLMRIADCFFAFPGIVMALLAISILGPGMVSLVIALALPGWPKYARVARSVALGLREQGYVEATRAIGAGPVYVLRRCILPGVLPPVATIATLGIGGKIIQVAALGFLGLGVQPPTPEWGTMLIKGLPMLGTAPHVALSATTAIAMSVLAFTLLGESLRDALDPRSGLTAWSQLQVAA
ncbi:ABC transporter permease [Oceanidesulfovibrio marinus]|uniref:ABC transporter permease n=1 Tax=Oceanidesulfovibrio marinus TaxID=370038 RepID=A0ABX6NJY8_9BACT|nr:ABC transporter permease [Oceanidesulfovibrio marinus]QJT10966.1 ABC transporter permease [Oceanidesulfovibrio marinus]